MFQRRVLMAAVEAAMSAGGGASAASKAKPEKIGIPLVDSDEFEKHYRDAKTGVPIQEAKDFAGFMDTLAGGTFFGSKYAKKFTSGAWGSMTLNYSEGKREVIFRLGPKGTAVADVLYGTGGSPVRVKGAKASPDHAVYELRNGNEIVVIASIKSGGGDIG